MKVLSLLVFALSLVSVHAVLDTQQAKDSLYQQIDLANKQLYDKAGQLKANFLDGWSDSDIKAWADAHSLDVPKSSEISAFAAQYRDLIQQDIDNFVSTTKDKASPFLNNIPQHVLNAKDSVVNAKDSVVDSVQSTYNAEYEKAAELSRQLYAGTVNGWSDSRLKAFLDARDIRIPTKADHEKYVELVKKNWDRQVSKIGSWDFDGWSVDDIKSWLAAQGRAAEGSRQQLVGEAVKLISDAQASGAKNYANTKKSLQQTYAKIRNSAFDTWNDLELKEYLESFGAHIDSSLSHSDLVEKARESYDLSIGYFGSFTNTVTDAASSVAAQANSLYSVGFAYIEEFTSYLQSWFAHFKALIAKTEL